MVFLRLIFQVPSLNGEDTSGNFAKAALKCRSLSLILIMGNGPRVFSTHPFEDVSCPVTGEVFNNNGLLFDLNRLNPSYHLFYGFILVKYGNDKRYLQFLSSLQRNCLQSSGERDT